MVFNSIIPKDVVIDNVTFKVKPLTALQQADIMDMLSSMKTNVDLVKAGQKAIDYALIDVTGLKDAEGHYVKPTRDANGNLEQSFLDGLGALELRPIVRAIVDASTLREDVKKN